MTGRRNIERIKDYVTGRELVLDEHEEIRQDIERLLVDERGFDKEDILVNGRLELSMDGKHEVCRLDLVCHIDGQPAMLLKTARSSIVSRERETLSAARLAAGNPIPIAVVTNGEDAEIFDTPSGKIVDRGLDAIPTKKRLAELLKQAKSLPLSEEKRIGETRILMAYLSWKCPTECVIE